GERCDQSNEDKDFSQPEKNDLFVRSNHIALICLPGAIKYFLLHQSHNNNYYHM
ncbi:hypothetical protein ACJX0J_038582, partial [Zea mays]